MMKAICRLGARFTRSGQLLNQRDIGVSDEEVGVGALDYNDFDVRVFRQ